MPSPRPIRPTFVTFDLGEQIFAVDVANVREILDAQTVAALPNATSDLLGMIDVRGQGIPGHGPQPAARPAPDGA